MANQTSSPSRENISLLFFSFIPSRLDQEGRIAIVTNVRRGCDGRRWLREDERANADGEVVWSWHPDADAKSRGAIRAMTGQQSPVPGEREVSRKPLRRECRMIWLILW
jgi:hypothetical protein